MSTARLRSRLPRWLLLFALALSAACGSKSGDVGVASSGSAGPASGSGATAGASGAAGASAASSGSTAGSSTGISGLSGAASGSGATAGTGSGSGGAAGASGRAVDGGAPDASTSGSAFDASAPPSASGWNNVAIGGGGFVSGIVFSTVQAGLVYARTDVGGFYRWDDGSGRWTALTDFFPSAQGNLMGGESLAADPTDPQVVYAAGGMYLTSGNGVILRSADQGSTWTVNPIPVPMGGNATGRGMGERLAIDPNNHAILLFGSRTKGLYRSTDAAQTWAPVTSFPTAGDANYGLPIVVFDKSGGTAAGSTTIYVAAASLSQGSNLYRTNDGGATWALVPGGPSGLMAHHASLGSDGTLWLAYSGDYGPFNVLGNALVGQIWKYASATGGWTNVTPPVANWGGMAGGISVDAQNPAHAIVSTLDWYAPDRLLATTDGGATWQVIAQPPASFNPKGSTYDVNGAQYWLVGGAFVGTGATNWVEAVALDPFDANHAMYGTGAGIWTSTDIGGATGANGQGVTWTFLDQGLEETVPIYLGPSVHGAFLGAIGDLGGMRNTNLSAYSTTGEYSNPVDNNTNGLDFAESNPNFVVRVGNSGKAAADAAYSNDNGQTWTPCASAPPGYATSGKMSSVAVSADGSRFIVSPFKGFGSPAFTTNDGATWTASTGLPSGSLLASDRVTATTFYATSGNTLYVSTNGGVSFGVANTFTGSGAPRSVFAQAGEVWIAANGGSLYRFTAAGATRTVIANVSSAAGVGFGMALPGQTHPATFLIGTVAGQYGFFRSDDGLGATWTRFNDAQHQYGWLQGNQIAGDEGVAKRAYLTTAGRGYIYYDAP